MKSIVVRRLLLILLTCFQMSLCAQAKNKNKVATKTLLNQIDAAHNSLSMDGMSMSAENDDEQDSLKVIIKKKSNKIVSNNSSLLKDDNAAINTNATKKPAEIHLAKLNTLLNSTKASASQQNVSEIIDINKKLISIFDKEIQEFRSHGISYDDSRIKQLEVQIEDAQKKIDTYHKQLKSNLPTIDAKKNIPNAKQDITSKNPIGGHYHQITSDQKLSKKPIAKIDSTQIRQVVAHDHVATPAKISTVQAPKKNYIVSHDEASSHAMGAMLMPKTNAQTTAPTISDHQHHESLPATASPSGNASAAPGQAVAAASPTAMQDHAIAHGATAARVIGGASPVDIKDHSAGHGGADAHSGMGDMHMPPAGSNVEDSAAYKNLHAYHSQGLGPSKFKLTPFGYVQNEMSYATRQLSVIQEFQPFLVPINAAIDKNNKDLEDRSLFIPALHAHVGALIDGPDVLGAKASGDISLEFYAPFPLNYAPATDPGVSVRIAGIILVHASMFIEWEKTVLLLGQTWHPGEDPEVSIAGDRVTFFGALADPMNRLFQIRVTQKVTPQFNFISAFTSNLDFKAAQNLGTEMDQTQNPYWLNFHFQARAKFDRNVFAIAADIYTEQPRLFETTKLVLDDDARSLLYTQVFPGDIQTCAPATRAFSAGNFFDGESIFSTKESVTSFSMMGFAKVERDSFVFKAKALVGSSLGHPLGGFTVIDQCASPTPVLNTDNACQLQGTNVCFDESSDQCAGSIACTTSIPQPCIVPSAVAADYKAIRGYGPMRLATFAAGIYLKNKIEPGIFFGFTKNLGSKEKIWPFHDLSPIHQACDAPTNPNGSAGILCLGPQGRMNASLFKYVSDLDYTIVISPRIKWTIAPVTFSAEVEYTRAAYGLMSTYGAVTGCSVPVDVIRFILEGSFNF